MKMLRMLHCIAIALMSIFLFIENVINTVNESFLGQLKLKSAGPSDVSLIPCAASLVSVRRALECVIMLGVYTARLIMQMQRDWAYRDITRIAV